MPPKGVCKCDNLFITGADDFLGWYIVADLVKDKYTDCAFVYYGFLMMTCWDIIDGLSIKIKVRDVFIGDIRNSPGLKEVTMC